MNESATQTVSFRLPTALAKQLADRGVTQNLSTGECARRIVLDALSDSANEQTRADLAELRAGLDQIRVDLATATAALLVNAGKVPLTEAKRWIRESLYHRG